MMKVKLADIEQRNQKGVDWLLSRNARNKTKPVPTQGKGSFSDALPEVAKVLQRLANENKLAQLAEAGK